MPSEKWKKIKKKLRKASREKDESLRGVRIAAVIADALREVNIDPVLVGGAVVSFYTEGKYTTRDIDMISPSGKEVDEVMAQLGFVKQGKDFVNETLSIYVEFPSDSLGPTEKVNVTRVDGTKLKIISLEDIIVDRLCAFKFWRSDVDGVNAMIMLELGEADKIRLEHRASEEDVLDALDYVKYVLETVIRKRLSPTEANQLLKRFAKRRK